jgi:hypothetical protein
MMGLEPTTFCMAKGASRLTTPDPVYGIGVVMRNYRKAVAFPSGPVRPRNLTWHLTDEPHAPRDTYEKRLAPKWRRFPQLIPGIAAQAAA